MEHHTSRARKDKSKHNGAFATAIVVILSIVLIAAIIVLSPIGSFLADQVPGFFAFLAGKNQTDQSVVSALTNQEPSLSANPSVNPTSEPVQDSLNVMETPFYILQMGVFTEQSDAEAHALKIRAMGAGGKVYQDGSVFRVFAAAYQDEESLMKVQSQVRKDGFEATPYINDRNSVHITLKGDQSALKMTEDAIELLADIPNQLCSFSLQFDRDTIDGIRLREELSGLTSQINETESQFADVQGDSVQPILTVLKNYQNRISTFLQEHDTINKTNAGELKLLQIECIIDYIQFFKQE